MQAKCLKFYVSFQKRIPSILLFFSPFFFSTVERKNRISFGTIDQGRVTGRLFVPLGTHNGYVLGKRNIHVNESREKGGATNEG